MADHDEICAQLETIVETLTDRSIERLRAAIADGATERPRDEKEIAKAQRAIDKAIRILRALDGT